MGVIKSCEVSGFQIQVLRRLYACEEESFIVKHPLYRKLQKLGYMYWLDSMNWDFSQPLSNAGGEMDTKAEGDWEECDEIYHELLNGVRRV